MNDVIDKINKFLGEEGITTGDVAKNYAKTPEDEKIIKRRKKKKKERRNNNGS